MNKEIKIGNIITIILALSFACTLPSCTSMPQKNISPVNNFEISKYLGDWYEIGRFDFKWEKDMKNVMANYSLNKDGSIKVTNSGFNFKENKNKQSIGKAKFINKSDNTGNLKVSFFGPFYSAYTVVAIDPEYKYSLVAGANNKLLWILSRTPTIPEDIKQNYIQIAQSLGYDLTEFIWTTQEQS